MGFSAEYVEGLSPAERVVYIQYYMKELEDERKAQSKDNGGGIPIGGEFGLNGI